MEPRVTSTQTELKAVRLYHVTHEAFWLLPGCLDHSEAPVMIA